MTDLLILLHIQVMDGWGGWVGEWMDGWMDGRVHGWVGGWVDGWMDGWMDGRTDGRTDRWTDFTSTVLQSYEEDCWMILKGFVQWNQPLPK